MRIRWNCLLTALLLAPLAALHAADLHVDARRGDDGNPGTLAQPNVEKTDGPKATLSAASGLLQPGDVCLIHAGTYRETLRPARSGTADKPITYKAAGDGPVIVTGASIVEGPWTPAGRGIFRASLGSLRDLGAWNNQVFVDGKLMIEARYPNPSTAFNYGGSAGFDVLEANVNSAKVSMANDGTAVMDFRTGRPKDYWKGCQLWSVGAAAYNSTVTRVLSSTENTLTLTQVRKQIWDPSCGWRQENSPVAGKAFLTGKFEELDYPGEWIIQDGSIHIKMPPGADSPSGHAVEIKQRGLVLEIKGLNHIVVEGITFTAGEFQALRNGDDGNHHTIRNCSFHWSNQCEPKALRRSYLTGSNHLVENCLFDGCASGCLCIGDGADIAIRNCIFRNINHNGVMGQNAVSEWWRNSSNLNIERCTFVRAGSDQVGARANMRYCMLSDAMLLADDRANYYVCTSKGPKTEVCYNWVVDRHNWSKQMRFGIYLDDGSHDFVVHHNVCWGGGTAFHVGNNGHSSTDHQIYNNTFLDGMITRNYPQWPMARITAYNNLLGKKREGPWDQPGVDWQYNYEGEDPGFVAPAKNDYRLQQGAIACIEKGIVVAGITDGHSGSKPDIGAYEYGLPNGGWEFYPPGARGKVGAPEGLQESKPLNR